MRTEDTTEAYHDGRFVPRRHGFLAAPTPTAIALAPLPIASAPRREARPGKPAFARLASARRRTAAGTGALELLGLARQAVEVETAVHAQAFRDAARVVRNVDGLASAREAPLVFAARRAGHGARPGITAVAVVFGAAVRGTIRVEDSVRALPLPGHADSLCRSHRRAVCETAGRCAHADRSRARSPRAACTRRATCTRRTAGHTAAWRAHPARAHGTDLGFVGTPAACNEQRYDPNASVRAHSR